MEGEKADGARKKVAKAAGKMLRIRRGKDEAASDVDAGGAPAAETAAEASE